MNELAILVLLALCEFIHHHERKMEIRINLLPIHLIFLASPVNIPLSRCRSCFNELIRSLCGLSSDELVLLEGILKIWFLLWSLLFQVSLELLNELW